MRRRGWSSRTPRGSRESGMTGLSQPHDRFFKEVLSRPGVAQDFLRHYLPEEVCRLVDLSSPPALVKDSFVDPALGEHLSDLLYIVKLRDGGEAYVYVLFEHKSAPERWMALHLLRYMVRIWDQSLREMKGKRLRQPQALRPILPLVVYHGKSRWMTPRGFQALVSMPEELRRFVPAFEYRVHDLSHLEDAELRGEVLLRVALLVMKYIFRQELGDRLPGILSLARELSRQATGLRYLETVLRYVSQGTDRLSREDLRRAVEVSFSEKGDEVVATLAEQWIEEGVQKGIQKGIQQGLREGLLAGIELGLETRFGREGLALMPKIRKVDDARRLRTLQEAMLKRQASLADLRRMCK